MTNHSLIKTVTFLLINLAFCYSLIAQDFTRADTLRGSITPERAWWNLQHYNLQVEVFPESHAIRGKNTITYTPLKKGRLMQIDLQSPMQIDSIMQGGKELCYTSEGNAHFIHLKKQKIGKAQKLTIVFSGTPRKAINAPWDGGFSWTKDGNGNDFIATSNQGIGASVWWPNKDHAYDEPEKGIDLIITAPSHLTAVGNGRLRNIKDKGLTKAWHWQVVNPINNYGVNINIGDYVNFHEIHKGLNGNLDMSYWVLRENLDKAREHFKQVPMMMEAFEYWMGPYPFYEDSFKLVETPYLGMEHQSSVTYGNKYKNGYLGTDLSKTGWGLLFDFIIIHESGHEWFANNITHIDVADMWIHESFTTYSESLYLDYHFSKKAASEYIIGLRRSIQNDRPIIGTYNVQQEGSSDMYFKGANILHTLRQLIDNDTKWRNILRGLNTTFKHQTVSSKQVEEYLSKQTGINLTEFWNQYLRTIKIPELNYKVDKNTITYQYKNIIEGFDMPVIITVNGKEVWIQPSEVKQQKVFKKPIKSIEVKKDFYINFKDNS